MRFFCPAIISPNSHGITPEANISVRSRRCFVLVAKALQNLSNGVLFGQKENFMMEMNSFIEGHKADIIAFFEEMSREEMRGKGRSASLSFLFYTSFSLPSFSFLFPSFHLFSLTLCFQAIDPVELVEALDTAHRYLYLNIEEIQEILHHNGKAHNTEGTVHSEIASKMTDGLNFQHKQKHEHKPKHKHNYT